MSKIQKLPIALCNQIAAGEVVEHPANIIKELVENSIDAQADSICIDIEHGGLQKIEIRDNGIGIEKEYLSMALERYATSKISSFEDMYALHTFGFRGEALASIASVSRLTLSSAYKKSDGSREEASSIVALYGEIKEQSSTHPIDGTCITIENLFLNTPARLKFLKSASVEQKKCIDVFLRLAFTHLNIEFTFSVGGRKLYAFHKNESLQERVASFFPEELRRYLIPCTSEYKSIRIHGLCSSPQITQKKADKVLLYVNNRAVNDKFLMRAIREGYKEYLTTKEYPFGIFFIDIPPDEVDVNVHPTKSEVRFIDESSCIKAVMIAIRNALLHHSEENYTPQNTIEYVHKEENTKNTSIWQIPEQPIISSPYKNYEDSPAVYGRYTKEYELESSPPPLPSLSTLSVAQETNHLRTYQEQSDLFVSARPQASRIEQEERSLTTQYRYICTVAETYLVYIVLDEDEVLLIDQHAAHERILEEYITRNASYNIQYLSPPVVIPLHPQEEEKFFSLQSELSHLGLLISYADGQLTIEGIPSYLPQSRLYKYIKELLLDISDDTTAIIHKKACTNAIKKGDTLLAGDAYELLKQWIAIPNNTHCPHGRPISVRLNKSMIEHLFKRVV